MRIASVCFGVCVAFFCCIAIAQNPANLVKRVYDVKDLPVWSQDGKKFDPEMLIDVIKLKVSSENWENGNGAMIGGFSSNTSLIINANATAHKEIAKLLASYRKENLK